MVLIVDNRKVVVITDATAGVGPTMVRNLCTSTAAIVYITSSSKKDGEELHDTLKEEGLTPVLRVLDPSSPGDVNTFASELKKAHGGVDILVTNARKQLPKSSSLIVDEAENLINQNFFNVVNIVQGLLPIVRAHGRVVVCATHPGVHYGREFLRDAPSEQTAMFSGSDVTMERVRDGITAYLESVASGAPWTAQVDIIVTLGLCAYVRGVCKRLEVDQDLRSLLVNVGSFGWVTSREGKSYLDEKGNHRGERGIDLETAAADVLWLAKLPRGTKAPHGLLMKNRSAVKWKQFQEK